MTRHFLDELRDDGFFLADVLCALDSTERVVDMGEDAAAQPKFELSGPAVDGRILSVVCSLKPTGAVLLITVYEGSAS